MDLEKVSTVTNWPTPLEGKDVKCILGFANSDKKAH